MDTTLQDQDLPLKQRRFLKLVVQKLSRIRALTLGYLIRYLHELSLNSDVNKMTPSNLSICFAPNLIGEDVLEPATALKGQQAINRGIGLLIEAFEEAFEGIEFGEELLCTEDDMQELSQPPVNVTHLQHQVIRCHSRQGRIIPFVPLCRLLKRFEPPERSPEGGEGEERRLTGFDDEDEDDGFALFLRNISSPALDLPSTAGQ